MKRLDEMSLKELKQLYYGERTLRAIPALILIISFIALFISMEIGLFWGWLIFFFAFSLVCNYGRSNFIKWLFRIGTGLLLLCFLCVIIEVFVSCINGPYTWQIFGERLMYLGVFIFIFAAPFVIFHTTFIKNLWGKNHHTYKEILEAYKRVGKQESFTDEDLPKGRQISPIWINIVAGVTFAAIFILPIVLPIIFNHTSRVSTHTDAIENTETIEPTEKNVETQTIEESEVVAEPEKPEEKITEIPKVENELDKLTKLAESGDVEALFNLGQLYQRGDVVEQNYEKTITYYQKAADKNYDPALYSLGRIYYFGVLCEQNYEKAMSYFLKSAKNGNSKSQEFIAQMYFDGAGVEQNYYKAFDYYFKAATDKNSSAQFSVGYMLAEGLGVKKNLELAKKYLEISAENGNTDAQNYLDKLIR